MKKRYMIFICAAAFIALPALAVVRSNSFNEFVRAAIVDSKKCSPEIEGLQLCISNPKLLVDSSDPVRIKLFWVNSTDEDRTVLRASAYNVKVTNGKREKLTPVLDKKIQEGLMTDEDKTKFLKLGRGSSRSLYVEANKTEKDEVWLSENYDYDLTAKGKYYVTISKTVPSQDKQKTVTYMVDDIEIEVR